MNRKVDIAEVPFLREVSHLEERFIPAIFRINLVFDFTSYHQGNELIVVEFILSIGTDEFPVPEYGEFVGNGEKLIQFMTDEKECHPLVLEGIHDFEKLFNFVLRQRRCRLIQYQQLGIVGQRTSNGHQLLFCN